MEENFIPRRLQEEKVLFWQKNEFVLFLFCFGCGMIAGNLLIGIFAEYLTIKLLQKLNKSGRQAFLLGFVYWNLPSGFSRFKKTPPSHIRTFIG